MSDDLRYRYSPNYVPVVSGNHAGGPVNVNVWGQGQRLAGYILM
jgi:hypothetical protein